MIELANGVSLPEGAVVQSIVCHMDNAREYSAIVERIQYDKTLPVIEVYLSSGGVPYEVPENAMVSVRLRKGDGKGVYNPALGLSEDRTKAYITVTQQMTVVPGDCRAVVEVAAGGGVICASEFLLKVTENPVQEGAIESEDEYLTITEILAQVQQMHSDVEGWKEQTLNYKKQAENMAINAVSSASSAADSATSAAASATQAGTSATNAANSAAQAEEASEHYPTISSDGYWQLWDPASGKYVKTTQKAQGPEGPTGPPVDTSTLISQAEKGVANGVATLDSSVKIPVSQIPSLDYIPTTQKGAASGVASLGSDGKIPVSQIPSLDYIQPDSVASLHGLVISRENEEPAPNNCIYSIATNGEYAHLISLTKSNHVCVAWGGDGVDSTDIYGGGDIIFRANHNQEFVANSLSMFREPGYLNRTIFRCDVDGGAFLGTATYRWNTAFFTNEITTSDLKEKEVIPDFDFKAKEFILGLKPIAYRRVGINDTGKRVHLGLGAQTLNQHIKDLALGDLSMVQASIIDGEQERPYYGEDIDDSQLSWGINYNELIAPMIKMLQEQQQQIDSLQAQVDELKRPQTSLETIKEE